MSHIYNLCMCVYISIYTVPGLKPIHKLSISPCKKMIFFLLGNLLRNLQKLSRFSMRLVQMGSNWAFIRRELKRMG